MDEQVKRLKDEITMLNKCLRDKNLALDAIGYVWCSGGCEGGVLRYQDADTCQLTGEQVSMVERNTIRLRSWYEAHCCREARRTKIKRDICDTCGYCFVGGHSNQSPEAYVVKKVDMERI